MQTLLSRLRRFRLDPVTVDRVVAVVFTIVAQLEIWLGTSAGDHQLGAALITPAMTGAIAIRRRYPLLVGVAVPVVESVEFAFWAGPNILSQGVANFCALYALTVWTPPRRFAVGFAIVLAAVVEERARIARELHDVIAHHVSMIVLQAGAERRVLGDANASTREVLETVERSGRSALTETRRLLGMLRGGGSDPLTPQPGLDDVPMLVGQ